ncbi:MAG: hypothetical protein NTW08_01210 [Gammaproteobacteria bacterium]|nr:hypothetical protein [Gammaproteobacteria bacterium]
MITIRKLRLKKEKFSRQKYREKDLVTAVGKQAHAGILFACQLFVAIFLTPVVVVSSLVSQEALLILAGVILALAYLASFTYRIYRGQVSWAEGIWTLIGLALFIGLAVYFLLPLFPVATSFLAIVSFAGIIATAINTFFLLKTFIFPFFKSLMGHLGKLIFEKVLGKPYHSSPLYTIPPLSVRPNELTDDRVVIMTILQADQESRAQGPLSLADPKDFNKRIRPYNLLGTRLVTYANKYHQRFLGAVRFSDDISKVTQAIADLTELGDPKPARDFFKRKTNWKIAKITLLRTVRETLIEQFQHLDFSAYNAFATTVFWGLKPLKDPRSTNPLSFLHTIIRRLKSYVSSSTHEESAQEKANKKHAKHLDILNQAIEKQVRKALNLSKILDHTTPCGETRITNTLTQPTKDDQISGFNALFEYSIFYSHADRECKKPQTVPARSINQP